MAIAALSVVHVRQKKPRRKICRDGAARPEAIFEGSQEFGEDVHCTVLVRKAVC